jgi:pterin-4a-carbinolamine dehydratase
MFKFVDEIVKIDCMGHKNCPSIHVMNGDLLVLEFYSASIDGLSQVDFDLALAVNRIDITPYHLIPIHDHLHYRKGITFYLLF